MDNHYDDVKEFFERSRDNDKFIELQKQINEKMSKRDQECFYNLLWRFDSHNRTAFVCNLWNTVCRNLTDSWMVFNSESEEVYDVSVELIDLIDGWLCECTVNTEYHEIRRITWNLHWIKED